MIDTLLIANRGEIACRIMRTAKQMGITTVAIHSDEDRLATHVRQADLAIDLGGSKPAESYLQIDKILAAAQASGAQAIHPGYGFLSENADFARACEQRGLVFIGPPPAAIEAMGSKSAAKALMDQAGVPLVPGYHGSKQDLESFRQAAAQIGYPVLLKASAGGGGKGMKVVNEEAELAPALASAQREAQAAFANDHILLERYLQQPRHVEIQIFADQHGNTLYLHDRDCSIQRRHQKVLEEAPAPGLSQSLRQAMGCAAVKAAKAIGYVGAGTIEFLLDAQGRFYFMEMNTRLQVEHPVTEAITGQDLVAWQLRIAQGEPLPLSQAQIPMNGHAIEVRLYAEDPDQDFLPASGLLELYREPHTDQDRRVDSGVSEGERISPHYDPMLGKLIAWGENREQARLRLIDMLRETVIAGVKSNLAFLIRVLEHPAFIAARLDTGFISQHSTDLTPPAKPLDKEFWSLAGSAWLLTSHTRQSSAEAHSPWCQLVNWRAGRPARSRLHLTCNGQQQVIEAEAGTNHYCAEQQALIYNLDGLQKTCPIHSGADHLYLKWHDAWLRIDAFDPLSCQPQTHHQSGGLHAPMNASVVRLLISPGDQVEAGAVLLVLEAMKMEHSIRAPESGKIKAVLCAEGDMVAEGILLVEMERSA